MAADRTIRWSTAGAVVGVAAVAAVASYEHAYDLVRAHGEVGWTARPVTRVFNDLRAPPSRDVPARSPVVATAFPVPAAQHRNH